MNPLNIVDNKYTKEDWYKFRAHLVLPKPWIKVILRNYSNFGLAAAELAEINKQYNEHLWNRKKMESEVSFLEKMYRISGVPVFYMEHNIPVGKPESQRTYNSILNNLEKFINGSNTMYFYSELEDNALKAATEITKKAIQEKFKCYMLSATEFVEEVTTFERTDSLIKLEEVDLAVLYFVGSEYARKETGFVSTHLNAFIKKRRLNNKTTILTSNLKPEDYKKRYNMPLTATVLEFLDTGIVKTMKELRDELRGGK